MRGQNVQVYRLTRRSYAKSTLWPEWQSQWPIAKSKNKVTQFQLQINAQTEKWPLMGWGIWIGHPDADYTHTHTHIHANSDSNNNNKNNNEIVISCAPQIAREW